jgi:hypothetical protein
MTTNRDRHPRFEHKHRRARPLQGRRCEVMDAPTRWARRFVPRLTGIENSPAVAIKDFTQRHDRADCPAVHIGPGLSLCSRRRSSDCPPLRSCNLTFSTIRLGFLIVLARGRTGPCATGRRAWPFFQEKKLGRTLREAAYGSFCARRRWAKTVKSNPTHEKL